MSNSPPPSKGLVVLAFVAIYLVWGSTYLAILFAIDTLPPFMMAGTRFLVAGSLLYAFLRYRGVPTPTRRQFLGVGLVGALLLGMGNGGVTWAEQRIPSGVASLLLAGTPAWMVLFDWLRPGGKKPRAGVAAGLLLGLGGIYLLIGPSQFLGAGGFDLLGSSVVLFGSMCWAFGSILSRQMDFPKSVMIASAIEMLAAGFILFTVGLLSGEVGQTDWSGVTGSSLVAMAYLIVFGSWVGFGAYVWLLQVTTPAKASTYAYVNPAVAVLLGWAFAGERVDARMILAMTIIISGVALITLTSTREAVEVAALPDGAITEEEVEARASA